MSYKVSSKQKQITLKIDCIDLENQFKKVNIINLNEKVNYNEFMREKYVYIEKTGDLYDIDNEPYVLYKQIEKNDKITYIFKALSLHQTTKRGRPKKEDVN